MSIQSFILKLETNLSRDAQWLLKEAVLVEQLLTSPLAGGLAALAKDMLPASEATAVTVSMTAAGNIINQVVNMATKLTQLHGDDIGTITSKLMAVVTDLFSAEPALAKVIPLQDLLNVIPPILALVNTAASAAVTSGPSTPAASGAPSPPSETPAT